MQSLLQVIRTNYNDYSHLYTNDSKSECGTSSALYVRRFDFKRVIKLSDNASAFTAELYAIVSALYWISQNRYAENLIISDSLSSIKAIHNHQNTYKHFLIDKIKLLHYFLDSVGVKVGYLWVPSHNQIPGNEIADALAGSASDRRSCRGVTTINLQLSICEVKSIIKNHVFQFGKKLTFPNQLVPSTKKSFLHSIIEITLTFHRYFASKLATAD